MTNSKKASLPAPTLLFLALGIFTAAPVSHAHSPGSGTISADTTRSMFLIDPETHSATADTALVPTEHAPRWFAESAGLGLATVLLWKTDQRSFQYLLGVKNRSTVLRTVSPVVTELGSGNVSLAGFGAMLLYGGIATNARATEAGIDGLESFAVSGAVTQLIKQVAGRQRPSASTHSGGRFSGGFSWFRHRQQSVTGYDSFPSGHTCTAFSAAVVLSDTYDNAWVTGISYGLASAVAVTRVMEKTHWLSDCLVGAAIGIVSAKAVRSFHEPTGTSFGVTSIDGVAAFSMTVAL